MRFISLLAVVVLMTSCTWFKKPTCDVMEKYTTTAATGLAAFLDCKNVDAMKEDLWAATEKLNLCSSEVVTGPLADIFCMPVAVYVSELAIKSLPARWECAGGAGAKAINQAIYQACRVLPY